MRYQKILLVVVSIIFLFGASVFITNAFAQCNETQKAEAKKLLNELTDIYNMKYEDLSHILYVDMEEGWHSMNIDQKNKFLRAIANFDACINGKARNIYINAWGEKVAEATPEGFKVFK